MGNDNVKTGNNEDRDLPWVREALILSKADPDAPYEVRKETADRIGEVIGRYIVTGSKLTLKKIAQEIGLGEKVVNQRKVIRFNLREALAEVLRLSIEDVPAISAIGAVDEGIREEEVNVVMVPPDKREVQTGDGDSNFEKAIFPRKKLATEVLREMGVDVRGLPPLKRGIVTGDMMRRLPYIAIIVPKLDRLILLCEEEGNQTFVVHGVSNPEQFWEMGKNELKDRKEVSFFSWNSDEEKWKGALRAHLESPVPLKNTDNSESSNKGAEVDKIKMDKNYFENVEYVKADLGDYAIELGEGKTPLDLNTGNMRSLRIECVNGEQINGETYVLRAGVALGLAENVKEASGKGALILKILLKKVGYELMDADYFNNGKYVKADLVAYALTLGEGKTPPDLSTFTLSRLRIKCVNGEQINGETYVLRAGVALGLAENAKEASGKGALILKILLKKAGYELMDADYFNNGKYVKADLEDYAIELGEGKTPLDLNTGNMRSLRIECMYGEEISGLAYVMRAGVALGLAKNRREADRNKSDILKILLRKAGYELIDFVLMDADYFNNGKYVKADLEDYAIELGEGKTPLDLSMGNMRSLKVKCLNGEEVNGITYILRAGVALGLANNSKESQMKGSEILKILLRKASYELIDFVLMNKDYFENPGNVRTDLAAYAKALGEGMTLADLNSTSMKKLKVECANGELVTGDAYVSRAAVVLGLAESAADSRKEWMDILAILKAY